MLIFKILPNTWDYMYNGCKKILIFDTFIIICDKRLGLFGSNYIN
jgi:hypothetical protein